MAMDNTKHALSPCQTRERSVLWRRSLATADPSRSSKTRQLRGYATRRYKEEGLEITTSHLPVFSSEEDVDIWIEDVKLTEATIERIFAERDVAIEKAFAEGNTS